MDGHPAVPAGFRTAGAHGGGRRRRSRRTLACFIRDGGAHAGSAAHTSGAALVRLMEAFTMDVLTLVAACGLAARAALFVPLGGAPTCASAAPVLRDGGHDAAAAWRPDITAAAQRFDIPAAWIAAVMRAESGGQATIDGQPIRSPSGAIGLMQVMPATYAALRARYGLGANPDSPHDNILAGTAYLREMLDRYGAPWFLAAYNVGPARLDAFLRAGRPLPMATQRYLAALAPRIDATLDAQRLPGGIYAPRTAMAPAPPRPSDTTSAGLFAAVTVQAAPPPERAALPIGIPITAPTPTPPATSGGTTADGFASRSVSNSASDPRGNGALFVTLR